MCSKPRRVGGALLALAALALSACQVAAPTTTADASITTTSVPGGLSVGADPTDLIQTVAFVDWEDLPRRGQSVRPPQVGDQREHVGVAVVLPGSEARRLYIAIWHNACMPVVTVSAPDPGSAPQVVVDIGQHPGEQCGEVLKTWPFEVTLNREVDPAAVVLEVRDRRPY